MDLHPLRFLPRPHGTYRRWDCTESVCLHSIPTDYHFHRRICVRCASIPPLQSSNYCLHCQPAWPQIIKKLLSTLSIINFDFNLLFFACSLRSPPFSFDWFMFELLPLWYAVYYFGSYYYLKWRRGEDNNPMTWNAALKSSVACFVGNP